MTQEHFEKTECMDIFTFTREDIDKILRKSIEDKIKKG
jgi:hypothetical protein